MSLFLVLMVALGLFSGCSARISFEEKDLGGRPGTAVLLDSRSGAVRSMVAPELASGRVFIAGDALRLATLLVALEKGLVDPEGAFHCPGEANGPAGPLRMEQALSLPCRHVFREIQRKIAWREMAGYLRDFGFGSTTGLGGPEEAPGDLPMLLDGEEAWDLWESRAIRLTPLQLANFFRRLIARDLPLARETMDRAIGLLRREETAVALSGSFREDRFSFGWSMAALGEGNDRPVVLVFLLGTGDGVESDDAARIIRTWWEKTQGD